MLVLYHIHTFDACITTNNVCIPYGSFRTHIHQHLTWPLEYLQFICITKYIFDKHNICITESFKAFFTMFIHASTFPIYRFIGLDSKVDAHVPATHCRLAVILFFVSMCFWMQFEFFIKTREKHNDVLCLINKTLLNY